MIWGMYRKQRSKTKTIGIVAFVAFEGTLVGALVGATVGALIGSAFWCVMGGPLVSSPSVNDIAFATTIGMSEGALLGAVLALVEQAIRRRKSRSSQ